MTPNNRGIRSQPRPYRSSWAGTKCFGRIPTLVTQGTNQLFKTKTKNKTEVFNQLEQQQIINTTVQKKS